MARNWGGKRPGSGKPKGYKQPKTLEKEAAREFVRRLVTDNLRPMLIAQLAHAMGIGHLYTRDKAGKYNKIENQAEVDRLLAQGDEGKDYWIFTKDPSVHAFDSLLNRALDKPKEQPQDVNVNVRVDIVARLQQARARLAVLDAKPLPPA